MSIIVTGFKSKDEYLNASEILVESIRDAPPEDLLDLHKSIRFEIISASSEKLSTNLLELLLQYQPQCCIFIGQAPGRNKITFERFATNLKDFSSPDIDGNQPVGERIESTGPVAYISNWSEQERLIEHLNANEIPAAFSNNGGNHLCNQILYQGLHFVNTLDLKTKCFFMHIPVLPIQVQGQWFDKPFISLEMAREAASLVLIDIFQHIAPIDNTRVQV